MYQGEADRALLEAYFTATQSLWYQNRKVESALRNIGDQGSSALLPALHQSLAVLALVPRMLKWKGLRIVLEAHRLTDPKIRARSDLAFQDWMANYNHSYSKPSPTEVKAILELYEELGQLPAFKDRSFVMLMNHLRQSLEVDS